MIFKRLVGSYFSISKAVCSIFLCILSISLSLEVNSKIIKPNENKALKIIDSIFFPECDYKKQIKMIKKIKKLDSEIVRSGSSIKEIEARDIYMSLYRQLQTGSDGNEYDFYHFRKKNLDYYIANGSVTFNPYMLVKIPDHKNFTFIYDWDINSVRDIINICKENKTPLNVIQEIYEKRTAWGGISYDGITQNRWARTDTKPNDALANAIIERSIFR